MGAIEETGGVSHFEIDIEIKIKIFVSIFRGIFGDGFGRGGYHAAEPARGHSAAAARPA